jgi:succinoglycan biosynthesis protein ExoA
MDATRNGPALAQADPAGLSPRRIALIMPVRNEAHDIGDVLTSLKAQKIDHARLLLLAIDGESEDGTREIIATWLAGSTIAGEVITNPRRTIPTSLNLGIARAGTEAHIVRLDGHTIYGPEYLNTLIEALESAPEEVACVGGPQHPIADASFAHRVVATLYSNPLGLGGSEHRTGLQTQRFVSQVYLGAWRAGLLQRIGAFDERWKANEDSEICARAIEAGYQILWLPVESRYRVNRGILQTIRQWGEYGYWRAQTLRRHPKIARPRHFAAPLGLLLALALAASPYRLALPWIYGFYLSQLWWRRDRSEPIAVTAASSLFLPACQITWASGVICGLCFPLPLKKEHPLS